MNQPARDRFIKVLGTLSDLHPEWRFGQLVANVSAWARGATAEAVWEDAEFLRAAEEHIRAHGSQGSRDRKQAV